MLVTRVPTALVGGGAFLWIMWQGGTLWSGLWAVLMALAAAEFLAIVGRRDVRPWAPALYAAALALPLYALSQSLGGRGAELTQWAGPVWLLLAAAAALSSVFDPRHGTVAGAFGVLGVFYLGYLPQFFLLLRDVGFGAVLLVFLTIWATDTAAYFTGRSLGRHKLAPQVSPNKTWEGALGGLLGAVLVTLGAAYSGAPWASWAGHGGWPAFSLAQSVAFGAVVAVVGQLGDLYESLLKRYGEVKDSGKLLPGHGGVLDRFDSALFAAPVAYYLMRLWAQG